MYKAPAAAEYVKRASREGTPFCEAVNTLMLAANEKASTEKHFASLESKIDELKHRFTAENASSASPKAKKETEF